MKIENTFQSGLFYRSLGYLTRILPELRQQEWYLQLKSGEKRE